MRTEDFKALTIYEQSVILISEKQLAELSAIRQILHKES